MVITRKRATELRDKNTLEIGNGIYLLTIVRVVVIHTKSGFNSLVKYFKDFLEIVVQISSLTFNNNSNADYKTKNQFYSIMIKTCASVINALKKHQKFHDVLFLFQKSVYPNGGF